MSEIVMETLRGLPYLSYNGSREGDREGDGERSGEGNREGVREIAPDTLVLDYLDEEGDAVEVWKDPFCLTATSTAVGRETAVGKEKGNKQGYLGNAIPLTSCIGNDGCLLLLDLDSSMYLSHLPSLSSLLSHFCSFTFHLFAISC
jgi:hypothetical protein